MIQRGLFTTACEKNIRSFYDQKRALALLSNILADTAKEYTFYNAQSAAAHNDKIAVFFLSKIHDRNSRRSAL